MLFAALHCALTAARSPAAAQERVPVPLAATGAIELPGVEGRIDHLALDAKRERLFVAALGNDTVEVVDLKAGKVERSLSVGEPQGILYLAELDRVVVTSGRAGTCDVFAGDTLEPVGSVAVGEDADNLRYDARSRRVYVACGSGALAIVDPDGWKLVERIPLAGHPESFQLDPAGKRVYVNVPGAKQLALVDLESRKVLRTSTLEAQANFPMAWVPGEGPGSEGLLLVGCRSPAKLIVCSVSSGEPVGTLDLSGDADDIFYDAGRRRAYVACGAGFVDAFAYERPAFRALTRFPTAAGARTCLFVPERNELFVAVPHRGEQRAEVRILAVRDE